MRYSSTGNSTSFFHGPFFPILILLLHLIQPAQGALRRQQQQQICACSPATYTLRLNLQNNCETTHIQEESLLEEVSCSIYGSSDNNSTVTDLVPTVVNRIEIIELGQDGTIVAQEQATGPFADGTVLTYLSHLNNPHLPTASLVRSIQARLEGQNQHGHAVEHVWALRFTNACEFPVLMQGDSIGWMDVIQTTLSPNYCPGVLATLSPTTASPVTALPTTATPTTALPTSASPTSASPTTASPVSPSSSVLPTTFAPTQQKCACSPNQFTFRLNLALDCPGNVVTPTGGLRQTLCLVEKRSNRLDQTNLVPVVILSIQILELNQELDVLTQQSTPLGDYPDGFELDYTAITSTNDTLTNGNIPMALQLVIAALNSNGEEIVNTVAIYYTNDCRVHPVLNGNEQLGWVELVNVTAARGFYCPAAETQAPTAAPTLAPIQTFSPTKSPTVSPIILTDYPTTEPTMSPSILTEYPTTIEPTERPVLRTEFPTFEPTDRPVAGSDSPTFDPTEGDSDPPSFTSSDAPSLFPSMFPSTNEGEKNPQPTLCKRYKVSKKEKSASRKKKTKQESKRAKSQSPSFDKTFCPEDESD